MARRVHRRKRRQTQISAGGVVVPLEWNFSSRATAPGETTVEIQVPYTTLQVVNQSPVDVWLHAKVGAAFALTQATAMAATANAFGTNITFTFPVEIDMAHSSWLLIPFDWPGVRGPEGQFLAPVRLWNYSPPLQNRRFVGWAFMSEV